MDKIVELEKLKQEIADDKSLPLQESNLVFGEGNPDCDVLFIGEAPGFNEDVEKRPFVGRAGQLLRAGIRELGWREEDVYITNIVKRRPPENRDPDPKEIENYKPYLQKQIDIICPKIIVLLGRFSMNYFLPLAKITRDQGKLFRIGKYFILPMLHPAAALRGNEAMRTFKETFLKLPAVLQKVNSGSFEEVKPGQVQKQQKPEDVQARLF
ncbi:MAG: Phage SPO1 DNA polymerase-related protein [Parcubacteria group bacterium GW2011_GWF2_38_8]|nr:MAG: Phage SPO1 DNA polymerase-related protein [Parcubacteria group bacterium GW2011_GWF2_38_8]